MNNPAAGRTVLTEAVCDEFERAYRTSRSPRIEEYLPRVPADQLDYLLGKLLDLDMEYRLQRGDRPGAPEYRKRFPGHDSVIAAAFTRLAPRPRLSTTATPNETTAPEATRNPSLNPLPEAERGRNRPLAPPPRFGEGAGGGVPDSLPSAASAPARSMAVSNWTMSLTVTAGPALGQVFTSAGAGTFVVGRSRNSQMCLADPHLSRCHFMLEIQPPRCRLIDLGSSNKTQINNQAVSPNAGRDLADGDEIRAGRTLFRISLGSRGMAVDPSDEPETLILPVDPPRQAATPTAPLITPAAPAVPAGPVPVSPDASEETEAPSGKIIASDDTCPLLPNYRIDREIGRGGMGVVYLATRMTDGARVALKTIIPVVEVAPSQVQRFIREANIMRQLEHENIVRFFEAGEYEGILYLTMSFVEGTDAARILKESGPMSVKTAVRMICQLLKALEYAHSKGFVHRDIKPGNMLIEESGGKKTVKLADFGLARVYQESRMSGLTIEGDVGGTPAFMPPEQITGFRQAKPAADQYAAAATLYTLLTGQYLFDFDKAKGNSLDRVIKEPPVPILQRRADLPPELAAIIHRALEKNPEQRFFDVSVLRAELKAFA